MNKRRIHFMDEKRNLHDTPEQDNLSELLQIRRDKLKQLQDEGKDPFQITKYLVDNDSKKYQGKL